MELVPPRVFQEPSFDNAKPSGGPRPAPKHPRQVVCIIPTCIQIVIVAYGCVYVLDSPDVPQPGPRLTRDGDSHRDFGEQAD